MAGTRFCGAFHHHKLHRPPTKSYASDNRTSDMPPGPRRDHGSFCLAARPAPPDKKGRKVWASGTSEHGHPKMKGKREKNLPTQPIGLSIMEGWPIVIRKDAYLGLP